MDPTGVALSHTMDAAFLAFKCALVLGGIAVPLAWMIGFARRSR